MNVSKNFKRFLSGFLIFSIFFQLSETTLIASNSNKTAAPITTNIESNYINGPIMDLDSLSVTPKSANAGSYIEFQIKSFTSWLEVNKIIFTIYHPEIGYTQTSTSSPDSSGYYKAGFMTYPSHPYGQWYLASIMAFDRNGGMSFYESDSYNLSNGNFFLVNYDKDNTAPVVDLSSISVDNNQPYFLESVKPSVIASDENTGVSYVSFEYTNYVDKYTSIKSYYPNSEGRYVGNFDPWPFGVGWVYLNSILVSDNKGNIRYYDRGSYNLSGGDFYVKNRLESIWIQSPPDKQVYVQGQVLDLSGLQVSGKYIDGSVQNLGITAENISGYDSSEPVDNQVITVTVEGKTTTFTVDIIAKVLDSIAVTQKPTKLQYVVGQALDLQGMEITGSYNDGTSTKLTISPDQVTGFDSSVPMNDQVVTVKVGDLSATFTVDIIPRALSKIEITTPPTKTKYIEGDSLDLSGLIVTTIYNDGTSEIIPVTLSDINGFDSSSPAENQVLSITVDGKTATFTVDIIAKALTSIEITNLPTKLEYIQGQSLDLTGLEVTGTYNNGDEQVLTITMDTITGFDSSSPAADQLVTITVAGKTATFTVDVIARVLDSITITRQPNRLAYVVGQSLDLTGLEVTGTYYDGNEKILTITMDNITGFDSSVVAVGQVVTITVDGKTDTFTVDVIAKVLDFITITKQPAKLVYVEGQSLDLTGLEVTGTYNDGDEKTQTITMDNITGFNSSVAAEDQVVTITVDGKKATFIVDFIAKALTDIEITKLPAKLQYIQGQELDLTGLEVTGIYNDGDEQVLAITMENITGYNSSVPAEDQVVTITVEEQTATFTVDIIAKALTAIEITKLPAKLQYIEGQTLDLTGLEITGTYNDGDSMVLTISNENITGFDSSVVAEDQVVTITIEGKKATFTVNIIAKTLTAIEITKLPAKLQYIQGQELDLTGIEVTGTYNDGNSKVLTISMDNITGFDSTVAAEDQVVTITVDGVKATFTVDIIAKALESITVSKQPAKLVYVVGQTLDLTGLEVTGTYNDSSTNVLTITRDQVTGFNSSKAANGQVLTVTVEGKTDAFSVDILARAVSKVDVISYPAKIKYVVGDELDLTGLVLKAAYNDGSEVEVPLSEVSASGFNSAQPAASQMITLTYGTHTFTYTISITANAEVKVFAGSNRFLTANLISKALYTKSDVAILVQADNFPDALAAGPLAHALGAPILLTNSQTLNEETKQELARLGVKKIVILGGPLSVSGAVETTLKSNLGYTVQRISGSNRYKTAVAVALALKDVNGTPGKVVLTSGTSFADALSAGGYAAAAGYPILTTDGKVLVLEAMNFLKNNGIKELLVMGGNLVVSVELEQDLKTKGYIVTRISGQTRTDTSAAIAKKYYASADMAIAVNGWTFADALAAAPFAARHNAPILLVNKTAVDTDISDYIKNTGIRTIQVVGGELVVPAQVRKLLLDAMN